MVGGGVRECNRSWVAGLLTGMERRDRFERLYRDYAGVVRTFARRRGDDAEADDVVAEVFLVVWRRLDDAAR